MSVQTTNVFETMAEDLELVDRRVSEAARVDFPGISTIVADIVKAGGKRLRPLIVLLAARAHTYDLDCAVTAAAGIELLHTASLVHDDHIDRASLRRGTPTLNTQLSSGAVILIGDFLFAQSAILAAATENTRCVSIFAKSLADICDGQLLETLDAHRVDQARADYERRIYGKTAALFAASAEMGAVIGQASEPEIQNLRAYGRDLGMAFQIIDDVLDLREGTQTLGKPAGNDIRQGVMNLPMMEYAAQLDASSSEYQLIEEIVAGEESSEEAIDALIQRVRGSGVLESCEGYARQYTDSALTRIEHIEPETRGFFQEIVDLAIVRSA